MRRCYHRTSRRTRFHWTPPQESIAHHCLLRKTTANYLPGIPQRAIGECGTGYGRTWRLETPPADPLCDPQHRLHSLRPRVCTISHLTKKCTHVDKECRPEMPERRHRFHCCKSCTTTTQPLKTIPTDMHCTPETSCYPCRSDGIPHRKDTTSYHLRSGC